MLAKLKASGTITTHTKGGQAAEEEEFDLLIIGGGATGAGCAVDAASRGLKVALVERDDFSAGAFFCDVILATSPDIESQRRNIVQVNQACPWRC